MNNRREFLPNASQRLTANTQCTDKALLHEPVSFSGLRVKSWSPELSRSMWLVALMFFGPIVLLGCNPIGISEHPSNKAKGRVFGSVRFMGETRLINGELNYGITTAVTVENIGQTGFIKVIVYLKSSEGEWIRCEEIPFTAGEYKTLTYFFPEPTLNTTNIECRANVSPW
jgi:hypothetical protein